MTLKPIQNIALFLLTAFCFLPTYSWEQHEQERTSIQTLEDSINFHLEKIRKADEDETRIEANKKMIRILEKTVKHPRAYEYDFDEVKHLGILTSPDDAFRIISWNLPHNDETHDYFAYVLRKEQEGSGSTIYRIYDKSKKEKDQSPVKRKKDELEKLTLSGEDWLGALYYKIIPVEKKNNTYYTLLGWDGNNDLTSKKVIETFTFRNKELQFGLSVFKNPEKRRQKPKKRVIFEYTNKATMSLKYHESDHKIVFDHLAPKQGNLEGMYEFYGPTLSFDAYQLDRNAGEWIFEKKVKMENDIGRRKPYNAPQD